MQSRCACAVVAGALASSALENLHVHTAQSHGMRVAAGLYILEIKYTPMQSHAARQGQPERTPQPQHFLLKMFRFVVAGAVPMSGHSCILR